MMIREAGITNIDMVLKEAYKLKEIANNYYIDISGKVKETGISREILGSVASLICFPSRGQKKVLEFLIQSGEVTKDFLVKNFGHPAYSVTVLTLYALDMVSIEYRSIRRKYSSGYNSTRIAVVIPNQQKIKSFWCDLFPEGYEPKNEDTVQNIEQRLHSKRLSKLLD